MSDVTQILNAIEHGDPSAAAELLPLVYDELRRLAAQKLAQEKPGQTLEATALVHEAYLRLVVPITEFCDQNHLTPRQRLELFVPVCHAVQHAHQKGIIHRDLKPSNVLVSRLDTTPVPKVIDFGVAKALGQTLTDKTLFTGLAQMVGTPLYMSPEQAGMSALDIDTRSDIYSLGVLLYELLTGTTPFTRERFKQAAYDEIRRIIREEEPPRPSTRLSESKDALPSISAQRQMEPAKLTKLVRGELDWIVMKALEKDRNRRYETANGFAMDLQHYLADKPVQACPPSGLYRFRKFARRNKAGLTLAGLILFFIVLLGGTVGWIMRDRAGRRADATFAVRKTLDDLAQLRRDGKWPTALALVQRAEALLDTTGAHQELRRQLTDWRADLEMVAKLEEIRLRKGEVNRESGELDNERTDRAYAEAFRDYGVDVEALAPEEAAERLRLRPLARELAAALDDWAGCRKTEGFQGRRRLLAVAQTADPDAWRNRVREAIQGGQRRVLEELAASDDLERLPPQTLDLLSLALSWEGAAKCSEAVLRRAVSQYPDDFGLNISLAITLHDSRPGEAVRYYTAAVALRPKYEVLYVQLAGALRVQGKPGEAEAANRKEIQLKPDDAFAYTTLGNALQDEGKLDEAEAAQRKAIELQPSFAAAYNNLSISLDFQGKFPESEAAARKAIQLKPDFALAYNRLGDVLRLQNRLAEGEAAYRKAIELKPDFAEAYCSLGLSSNDQGKLTEAVNAYRKAIEVKPDFANAYNCLGVSLQRQGKFPEAEAAYRKAIEVKPDFAMAYVNVSGILGEQKRWAAALLVCEEALAARPSLADDPRMAGGLRYNAACCAARLGCGYGKDAGVLTDTERARRREQALAWLRADLTAWRRLLEKEGDKVRPIFVGSLGHKGGDTLRPTIVEWMRHWQADADFAGVRGPKALARLPAAERLEWQKLWEEIAALQKRVAGPK